MICVTCNNEDCHRVYRVSWGSVSTAHNWQKWKSTYLTCPCHEMYRVEAVGLKNSSYTLKITILWICEIWGNSVKIWYFVNNCLRGLNWIHFAHRPQCTVILNSNFAIFKTWNCFSIGVKESYEPIVLWKKATGSSSFYKHFLEKPIFE